MFAAFAGLFGCCYVCYDGVPSAAAVENKDVHAADYKLNANCSGDVNF